MSVAFVLPRPVEAVCPLDGCPLGMHARCRCGSLLGDHVRKILFDEGGTKPLSADVMCLLFDANELRRPRDL